MGNATSALTCVMSLLLASAALAQSTLERVGDEAAPGDGGELRVEIVDADSIAPGRRATTMPARVVVTGSDGMFADGAGRGVYLDGRFFVDGNFIVKVPPGETKVHVRCGPGVIPLEERIAVPAGRRVLLRARMKRWLAPEALGWYGGDNHVHTQHDARAVIKVDPGYTALQGRANGLAFVTEADPVDDAAGAGLDTDSFLYRRAPEIRPGPFVGHLNTPGLPAPLAADRYKELVNRPLPRRALHDEVRAQGAAMIHTHILTPPHLLHWMGATQLWSDAALGHTADLVDLDSPATEALWFAALNLGNRVGASGSTDCALGRRATLSPGDRRVYCKADKLDYGQIVASMRSGRTIATSGGPLLVTAFSLADAQIGGTIDPAKAGGRWPLRIECHSLLPLRTVQVTGGGRRVKAFDGQGRTGPIVLQDTLDAADPAGWYVVRAENVRGGWAVTSPIYVARPAPAADAARASAVVLTIANHTRFIELRKTFFAHAIATVRPPEAIAEVRLMRDHHVLKSLTPADPDKWHAGQVPVTGIAGDYGPGWAWHKEAGVACHVQMDWPVRNDGWYRIEVVTSTGRTFESEALRFDDDHPMSHAISAATLAGPATRLVLHGYAEEMPLAEIKHPFEGDHWWYPQNAYWRMQATFGPERRDMKGGPNATAAERFRPAAQ